MALKKSNANKYALIIATVFTVISMVDSLISSTPLFQQVFIPSQQSQTTIPQLYFLNYTIAGCLIVFIIVFTLSWLFAKLYNRIAIKK